MTTQNIAPEGVHAPFGVEEPLSPDQMDSLEQMAHEMPRASFRRQHGAGEWIVAYVPGAWDGADAHSRPRPVGLGRPDAGDLQRPRMRSVPVSELLASGRPVRAARFVR